LQFALASKPGFLNKHTSVIQKIIISTCIQNAAAYKKNGSPKKSELPSGSATWNALELRQGKADAEMLMEKKD
jgi:hypothetical protein